MLTEIAAVVYLAAFVFLIGLLVAGHGHARGLPIGLTSYALSASGITMALSVLL